METYIFRFQSNRASALAKRLIKFLFPSTQIQLMAKTSLEEVEELERIIVKGVETAKAHQQGKAELQKARDLIKELKSDG